MEIQAIKLENEPVQLGELLIDYEGILNRFESLGRLTNPRIGKTQELRNIICHSENLDAPTLFYAVNTELDQILFIGGLNIAILSLREMELTYNKPIKNRDNKDTEHWYNTFIEHRDYLVFEYEGGFAAVTESFQIDWNVSKYYTERLVEIFEDFLIVKDTDGNERRILISSNG